MNNLKFAVIGTGFWSTLQIPAWFEVGGVELVALYNRTIEKAKNAAKKYGNPKVYEDPEEMFKKEKLDFVDIITEVPAHEKFVLMAAKYKVPVICQKPMSFSFKSCLKMVNACRKANIPFFIHENYRYMKHFRVLKDILKTNLIGKINFAEIALGNGGESSFKNQPFLATLPYFIFTDMGPHLFDVSRFLFGEPLSVYGEGLKVYDYISGPNILNAILKYKEMICVVVSREYLNRYVIVEGNEGFIEVNTDDTIIINNKDGVKRIEIEKLDYPKWAEHVIGYISPHEVQMIIDCNRSFYNALVSKTKPETDSSDNIKSMNIVFKAVESYKKKKAIII